MNTPELFTDPHRAWARYEPCKAEPWDRARVGHLHRRAGFSPSWAVLERDVQAGPEAAIQRLLDGEPKALDGTSPAEFARWHDAMAERLGSTGALARAQAVWLYRMIFTPHPLQERMTLFWHNHFATSNVKVNNLALMQQQVALLRRHALGDFQAMLLAMGKDPAMLIWLDSTANRKAHPNENYAREVMELFTLGRGHYTEKDIQEAARAFTGWFVSRDRFHEVPAQHDDGEKTILGHSGKFEGDDVARILVEQPACAEFLCRKLFRQFVSEIDEPSPELIAPLAQALRDARYEIKAPVAMILRSRLFHDAAMRRRRVKSPVEYAVGLVRSLEVLRPTVSTEALANTCTQMGQSLFAPPSVAGWDGGPAWINTTTSLARTNLALGVLSDSDAGFGKRLDPRALAERHGASSPDEIAGYAIDLAVQDAFPPKVRERVLSAASSAGDASRAARDVFTMVLTAPEYQLG